MSDVTEAYYREMIVLAAAGLGVSAIGFALYLIGPARRWLGAGAMAGGVTGTGLGAAAALDPAAGWAAAGITALVAVGIAALGSGWVARALAAGRSPAVRAGGMGALGLALLVGAVARFDLREEADLEADENWLDRIAARPATREVAGVTVATDRARRIYPRESIQLRSEVELRTLTKELLAPMPQTGVSLLRGPASDACNCHGWVFTGGRYWLGPDDVQAILAENGYAAVTAPRPGDLAIYRQGDDIIHTAVVRAVGPDIPVLVEGKWGWMGVYLHPVDGTAYGKSVTYYRSPRQGHLLVGLGGRAPAGKNPASDPELIEGGQ